MNDKEIRSILIEYLKIKYKNYRIYQEKSIGASVCDLMLVTKSMLTGFEIKSDTDNYERLNRQIREYEQFFDENYIVVGQSHAKSIVTKIPHEWGILVVNQSKIEMIRGATKNRVVNRERQLSILWKLELKNLLIKNNMNLFAQREKPYIIEQLVNTVEPSRLGRQIAEELLSRDYSIFDAEDYTIKDIEAEPSFVFPTSDLVDHLSEQDLSSFTLDKWMSIYEKAVKLRSVKEEKVARLETETKEKEALFHKIPYTDIEVSLGVPWVSPEIISQFAIDVFKVKQEYYHSFDPVTRRYVPDKKVPLVQHEPITGYWYVEKCKNNTSVELNNVYGTGRYNAMQILEATLNLRQIKIHDGTKYNEMETISAIEKQKLIKEAFKEWIWQDKERIYDVEKAYNKLFGQYEKVEYDGSDIEFKGINPKIELFKYQKDAVKKIITTPNTLLAFDVGAGKTYIMIASAMEMRRSGLSRKNLFVVPNNIVGQWEKMFTDLYPKAKVLAVEPKSFTPEKRNKVLKQIQRENYDGIIMAYSCFDMIPLSQQYLLDDMHDAINEFSQRMRDLNKSRLPFSGAESSINREMDYTKKLINDLIGCMEPKCEIGFQELEINTIFIDEAHNFKNIPLRTNMRYLRGINTKGSKKCLEMLKKVQSIQLANGGRGAVFATGTPLCNSISDTYAMQCYLQFDELKKKKIERFDNWVKTFAQPEDVCEIDVDTSSFRVVSRFRKFHNLVELSKMFSQISIFHNVSKDGLPEVLDYYDEVVEKSDELDKYMKELYARTENVRSGEVDRKKDNMLKISTDGRKAALSLNLVGKEQPYNEECKLFNCVKNVIDIYNEFEGSTQLVFCDYSTPKKEKYNVYKDLKERLIENGIPKNEIAFIHSCKNEEQKVKLYDDVNNGRVRVLIGSTFKLGIGANVQKRLKAIHHLDVPWRPADMVQREGRIMRRGNENSEIRIYRYVVEGSFDSYSWQILQTKQHFISQFLSGSNTQRSIVDFDNDELSYAEVKALALSEPLMKNYAEKENELRSAKIIYRQEALQKETNKKKLTEFLKEIDKAKKDLILAQKTNEYILKNKDSLLDGVPNIASGLREKLKIAMPNGELGSLLEFKIFAPIKNDDKHFVIFERGEAKYYLEIGESDSGNRTRIKNFIVGFEVQIKAKQEKIKALKEKEEKLKEQINYSSTTLSKIKKLEEEIKEIFSKISKN